MTRKDGEDGAEYADIDLKAEGRRETASYFP